MWQSGIVLLTINRSNHMQNINELTKDLPQYGPRESLSVEYKIYLECANDGNGKDITTGADLLTFDEWLES